MTLLEAARALAGPISGACDACTGSASTGHFPECPLAAMPRIVAVLEAAERVGEVSRTGWFTGIAPPVVREPILALVAALKGDAT